MKKIILLLFCWGSSFYSVSAQEKELNISFDERNKIITEIEEKIEKFISENRNRYKLTENRIDEIKQRNKEGGCQVYFSKFNEVGSGIALDIDKDYQLRKLYFVENPDDKKIFEKLAKTNLSPLLKYNYKSAENNCDIINGGFEEPFESGDGYIPFRLIHGGIDKEFDCSVGNIESGGMSINTPTTMNNTNINVFDSTIVHFTLTQTGTFEPSLFNEGVEIDVVKSGNRALRLNNNRIPNVDNTSATRLTKTFIATDEYVSLYFNFVFHFSHTLQNDSLLVPRFIFRLYKVSTNEILSEFCRFTDPNNELLFNSTNNFIYTDWQYSSLNTKGVHMNQTVEEKLVRLEVIATDCGQIAHYGNLYIDDICSGKDEDEYPVYGEVEFTNPQGGCPSFPLEVCGSYKVPRSINESPPTYGEVDYIHLNILDENNNIVNTITTPTSLTSLPNGELNTFCFTLNESDFGVLPLTGGFDFQIVVNFIIGGNNVFVTNTSAIQGFDVCCNECCPEHVTLTGTVDGSVQLVHSKEAEHTLNARNRIILNASASYHAGDMVSLSSPFHINAGSSLMAYIEGCSGTYQFKKNENLSNDLELFIDGEYIALEKIESGNVESTFSIYPNPATNVINIANSVDAIENVTITDMNGRVVKEVALGVNEGQINISDLSQGVYILNATSNGNTVTEKIVKK